MKFIFCFAPVILYTASQKSQAGWIKQVTQDQSQTFDKVIVTDSFQNNQVLSIKDSDFIIATSKEVALKVNQLQINQSKTKRQSQQLNQPEQSQQSKQFIKLQKDDIQNYQHKKHKKNHQQRIQKNQKNKENQKQKQINRQKHQFRQDDTKFQHQKYSQNQQFSQIQRDHENLQLSNQVKTQKDSQHKSYGQKHGRPKHHKRFKLGKLLFFVGLIGLLTLFFVKKCIKNKTKQNKRKHLLKEQQSIESKIKEHYAAIQELERLKVTRQRQNPIIFYQDNNNFQNEGYYLNCRNGQSRTDNFYDQSIEQPFNQLKINSNRPLIQRNKQKVLFRE